MPEQRYKRELNEAEKFERRTGKESSFHPNDPHRLGETPSSSKSTFFCGEDTSVVQRDK
jgi:hypothetical protein